MKLKRLGSFLISKTGIVWSLRTRKYAKQVLDDRGNPSVWNQNTTVAVSRLVAMAWLPNPHGFNCVRHVDGNVTNNHVNNLEWTRAKRRVTSVCCYNAAGELVASYASVREAANCCDCEVGSIYAVLYRKQTVAGGFRWRLASDAVPRLHPLTTQQVYRTRHSCSNFAVRNLTTGEVFSSHAQLRAAGYEPTNVAHVVVGRLKTHAKCEWERIL